MAHKRQQFTVAITCSNCRTPGAIIWEEARGHDRARGSERRLMSIHGEFHRETDRTESGDLVIVCNLCDEIQPD